MNLRRLIVFAALGARQVGHRQKLNIVPCKAATAGTSGRRCGGAMPKLEPSASRFTTGEARHAAAVKYSRSVRKTMLIHRRGELALVASVDVADP